MSSSARKTKFTRDVDWRHILDDMLMRRSSEVGNRAVDAFSDEALVSALIEHGHRKHAEMLLTRYREKVFHIVLSVTGPSHAEEAQDLTQEVCVRMLQKIRQFRQESQFSTWVYRMAFNAALDHQRRIKRKLQHLRSYAAEPNTKAVAQPGSYLLSAQAAEAVQLAVAKLPDTQRIIIRMHYWLELPVAEIAELLGTVDNTVKSHLRRARMQLGHQLKSK